MKTLLTVIVLIGVVIGGYLLASREDGVRDVVVAPPVETNNDRSETTTEGTDEVNWRTAPLIDVATGEEFTIAQFAGTPVLLESFAVWCPTCLRQQREIKKVEESLGDAVVHISLDTDQNEEASTVQAHIDEHGFDWYFAVSPPAVTRALIDDFGFEFVNAPSAPTVLICENGEARFLKRGVKTAAALEEQVRTHCTL